jgi:glycosyltransferase involved in cell wall biosynthesis
MREDGCGGAGIEPPHPRPLGGHVPDDVPHDLRSPRRVVVLDHTAKEGGAELALLRLAEALPREAVDVRVLLFEDGPLRGRLREAGIPTAVLELDPAVATASRDSVLGGIGRTALVSLGFVPRLARAIRGARAGLVVANSLKSAVFAAFAAPLAGRRWVWHLHDRLASDYLPRPLVVAMRTLAVLGPARIVVNSRATLATLPRRAQAKAVVAYPGLPDTAFAVGGMPSTGGPVVGIVGRLSPTKGQREFLEAAAAVAGKHPEARFVIVGAALFGEDAYADELRTLAARLGVAERVEFTGWIADVAPQLRRLSVLVHASPVPEPFGQVVVEAMAAGIPVVATAAGGIPEILDETGDPDRPRNVGDARWRATPTGMLVRPGDSAALAEALEVVLDDPGATAARAEAARDAAERRFTIARTTETVCAAWLLR